METMLTNNLEHLDFDKIFLTGKFFLPKTNYFIKLVFFIEKMLKIVCKKCKNVKILSLKDCGYFLNDHFFEMLLKVYLI
jgi:hypothetical protein